MITGLLGRISELRHTLRLHVARYRKLRRWDHLRRTGLHIGKNVNLPDSTWIDPSHRFLVSIGDNCGFGVDCLILAHDALANEFIAATRIGRVTIHESCHIGARTVILPGVEIGPRCIVGAGSVVTRSIPPNTVAAGNPARVLCTLDEYLAGYAEKMKDAPQFPFAEFEFPAENPPLDKVKIVLETLGSSCGYVTNGRGATVKDVVTTE